MHVIHCNTKRDLVSYIKSNKPDAYDKQVNDYISNGKWSTKKLLKTKESELLKIAQMFASKNKHEIISC
jgi:hypothetical protein